MNNAVVFAAIIAGIIVCAACGCMCSNLAEYKGYSTKAAFWCGILLGAFALIYYAGLPISDEKRKECNNSDNADMAAQIIDFIHRECNHSGHENGSDAAADTSAAMPQPAIVGTARRIPDVEDVRGIPQCKCSECGTRQNSARSRCWHCGRVFED